MKFGRQPEGSSQKWIIYAEAPPSFLEDERIPGKMETEPSGFLEEASANHNCLNSFCGASNAQRRGILAQLQKEIQRSLANNLHSPSLLLSVTQFNTIHAACTNAATFGLTIDILRQDIASQFNILGPWSLHLPPSLQPTSSQKDVLHHPWIDLIPIISLRTAMLKAMDLYDEDELCEDIYGLCDSPKEVGLISWGEAWDPMAYEVTKSFIWKWSWILKDCPDLMESTNYWRRKRGEKPLTFLFGTEINKL